MQYALLHATPETLYGDGLGNGHQTMSNLMGNRLLCLHKRLPGAQPGSLRSGNDEVPKIWRKLLNAGRRTKWPDQLETQNRVSPKPSVGKVSAQEKSLYTRKRTSFCFP